MLAFKQSNFEQREIFFFGGGEGEGKRSAVGGEGGRQWTVPTLTDFATKRYFAKCFNQLSFPCLCFVDKSMTPE